MHAMPLRLPLQLMTPRLLTLNSEQYQVYGADCSKHVASPGAALSLAPALVSRVKLLHARHITMMGGEWVAKVLTPLTQLQALELLAAEAVRS